MVGAIEEVLQPRVVRTQTKHRYTYLLLIHSFIIVIIIIIIIIIKGDKEWQNLNGVRREFVHLVD